MRRLKKIVSLCLAFLMLLTIFPQQVEAASYELHFTTIMFTKGAEQFHTYSYKLLDDDNKAKITKAVLKDKSLATVSVSPIFSYSLHKNLSIHLRLFLSLTHQ